MDLACIPHATMPPLLRGLSSMRTKGKGTVFLRANNYYKAGGAQLARGDGTRLQII
jgi:hypothetical protein